MKLSLRLLLALGLAGVSLARPLAAAPSPTPADAPALTATTPDSSPWTCSGVTPDPALPGPDGAPTYAVAPGAKTVLKLRDTDGSGRVVLSVYDDAHVAVPGRQPGIGPRWGVTLANGRVLAGGIMYARYLAEEGSVCLMDVDPQVPNAWLNLHYLSGRPAPAWHRWEFNFDANKGLIVSVDGKALPASRFDWNASQAPAFNGIVLYGDDTKVSPQTLHVSGIGYALGGPMNIVPVPPPPPPPIVPDTDPVPEGDVPQMKAALLGQHPRLFANRDTLPKLREFYRSEAGKPWRTRIEEYLPSCTPPTAPKFLDDATDGQRQGLWRLPTVALHYLVTGDQESFRKAKGFLELFVSLPHWETGTELDSGMSSSNIMVGAALAYDWLYDQLDPAFRAKVRDALLYHARATYYGGHLMRNPGVHYWQNDPANNHRWHRNAGLTLAILAIYENKPEERWILQQTVKDLTFVSKWLPEDGTSHEGPTYLTFGGNHLTLALDTADGCLGTHFLEGPYFRNVGLFRTHLLLPGGKGAFRFGDSGGGDALGVYNNFFLRAAAVHREGTVRDALLRLETAVPTTQMYGWFSLLWDDPTLAREDMMKLPTSSFWPDIGFATMRESWDADAVAASFKCGPFGGYTLNEYIHSPGSSGYGNVAHDDPDANEFLIAMGDELVFDSDGYSAKKMSAAHNTVLINGLGQMSQGRPEGEMWSQPGGDMRKMGVVTAYRDTGSILAVEGEAAGSYLAYKDKKNGKERPAIDRFRRTMLWVKGGYILILDDVRAPKPVDVQWLVQGKQVEAAGGGSDVGRYVMHSANRECAFQVAADQPLTFKLQDSPADDHGKPMGLKQLAVSANGTAVRVVSLYDPWKRGNLSVKIEPVSADEANVVVEGGGMLDAWNWKSAPDRATASTLSAERREGPANAGFPFQLDANNSKPPTKVP